MTENTIFSRFKGIIFDFDGTLYNNNLIGFYLIKDCPPYLHRIWKEHLIRKQFAGCEYASSEEYYQFFFTVLGKACSLSPARICAWYFDCYMPRMVRVLNKHYKPRPGAVELFQMSTALKFAVYSDYPFLKERTEAIGFCFGSNIPLYDSGSFGAQKPAVSPLLCIAKDIGVAPEEILVVGDREETDGLGAFHAGMHFFYLKKNRKTHNFSFWHNMSQRGLVGTWDDLMRGLQ